MHEKVIEAYAKQTNAELHYRCDQLTRRVAELEAKLDERDKQHLGNVRKLGELFEALLLEIGFENWDKRDDYLKF